MSQQQGTIEVRHLVVGTVYRDVLSGNLVLVRELHLEHHGGPVATAWMWNPTCGAHQRISVYDHQLESAQYPSKLKSRWG